MISETIDLVSYWSHVLFGVFAYGAGLVALGVVKGSRKHVRAGRIFAVGMTVAALTSLVFALERPLPLLFVQAAAVLYLVPSSILALRWRRAYAKPLEGALVVIPLTICVFALLQSVRLSLQGALLPPVGALLIAVAFGGLAFGDIRWMTSRPAVRGASVPRHLKRMILAFAFASMAVLREAVPLGLPFPVTVILPLLVAVPLMLRYDRRLRRTGTTHTPGSRV